MANNVVVIAVHVAHFAGITRPAGIELAIDNDANADAPAHVYEHHMVQTLTTTLQPFAISHAACVVVDGGFNAQTLC